MSNSKNKHPKNLRRINVYEILWSNGFQILVLFNLFQNLKFLTNNSTLTWITRFCILVQLKSVCDGYHKRIIELENRKFDLEKEVEFREFQVELEGMNIAQA